MKIEEQHIKHIKDLFQKMESRQDLLEVINYAKEIIYGDKYFPISLKQLTYYANPKRSKKSYKTFEIKKKAGGIRKIHAPSNGLKELQKPLALILQCIYQPNKSATGFIIGKSIVDNAIVHTNQNYVYNIDLKDFFTSIDQARVWACLQLEPFNLKSTENDENAKIETGIRYIKTEYNERVLYYLGEEGIRIVTNLSSKRYMSRLKKEKKSLQEDFLKYISNEKNYQELYQLRSSRLNLASMIAAISCTIMTVDRKNNKNKVVKLEKSVLPQGAATSPIISNIVCQRLDRRLNGLAKRIGVNYTRYADDITFSSMHNVYQENSEFLKELTRIVNDQKFEIKQTKTRLQKRGFRQEVTGLVVNDKVNVKKRYVKQVRMWLYYWEKYGYFKAESIFLKDYQLDKGHSKGLRPNFINVLSGKLEYLKMIKGEESTTYNSLNKRYQQLVNKEDNIDAILTEWENNGIDRAIQLYKKFE